MTSDMRHNTKFTDQQTGRSEAGNEIDLGTLWGGIRKRLPWVLLATLIAAGATYLWFRVQPNVYEASSSLVTLGNSSNIGALRDSLVTASPLPEGALQEALSGPVVMGSIIQQIGRAEGLPPVERTKISGDLQKELQKRHLRTVELQSRLDPSGNGIYTVLARASSPDAAVLLADLTAQSLLNWDRSRALSGVERAARSLRAQLTEVDRQLAESGLPTIERDTLIASRSTLQRGLAQAGIQSIGVTGSLEPVASAVAPLDRVAPKPARNAVLVGLLTLLVGLGLTALRTVTDRTARNEDDLLSFGLPTLGIIPRLRKRDIVFNGIVRVGRQTGLYEAVGFLRVNILSRIGSRVGQRIMISSTAPGEGKSSLTATLADTVAASGQRVLIIDADMRRGTQQEVWDKYEREHTWLQLVGEGGARTLQSALADPKNVQVMQAEPNVHVLPAGPGMHDSLGLLNRAPLSEYFDLWGQTYDLILIDSPPLLALADGLVLGRHVDHVLLVVEGGKTSLQAVKQSLRRAQTAQVNILGFVLNKVTPDGDENGSYGYSYGYSPKGTR